MKAEDILGSPPAILCGVILARTFPRAIGYGLAHGVARFMAARRNHLFCTLRGNLAHVLAGEADDRTLDALAEEAIYHAGRTYVDLLRVSVEDLRRERIMIRYDEARWARVREAMLDKRRGTVLVGPHMSNFDLAAQWFIAHGLEIQALSLAGPDAGDQVMNRVRARSGMIVTPIDTQALRLALHRLRQGGVVMTGVDRPASPQDPLVPFFDGPARMPTGHIRLAMQTGSNIVVACCVQEPDGCYAVRMAEPLEIEVVGDRDETVRHNTLRVLAIIEEMIRLAPAQWLMFVPVWRQEEGAGCRVQSAGQVA